MGEATASTAVLYIMHASPYIYITYSTLLYFTIIPADNPWRERARRTRVQDVRMHTIPGPDGAI
jgi:hypothetical protein